MAGEAIDLGDDAARLRRCPSCHVLHKHPFVADERLLACYRTSGEDQWEHDPDPLKRRFDQIANLIQQHAPDGPVLDVGCSNGALLAYLARIAPSRGRFGLEPSIDAARIAEDRGVRILGATFEEMGDAAGSEFAAILAIDVLEHVTDPARFVARIAQRLGPGGVFIGLTGDHATWGWRLQGAAYWYAALPEHQIFYTRATIDRLAADHGLDVIEFRRTSHARQSVSRTVRDSIRGTVAGVVRRLGFARDRPAPGWLPARDHMLFVLRRPDSNG